MRQEQSDIGHSIEHRNAPGIGSRGHSSDFVFEKSIFNNVFEKDIRRVYIYKKAERLAKAIHLVTPAFAESVSLRNRIDAIAVGLVDSAILPSGVSRLALSRELLALSSVLGIAHSCGLLSPMNADLISREAHILLQEVASYEEPRLILDNSTSLSEISRKVQASESKKDLATIKRNADRNFTAVAGIIDKGHVKDRREAILSVIRNKKRVSIKDISVLVRGVSEKTIQRELSALIDTGTVSKEGERRWSTYSLTL
jgi:DNA-binding transcriptional ArsR family regulator